MHSRIGERRDGIGGTGDGPAGQRGSAALGWEKDEVEAHVGALPHQAAVHDAARAEPAGQRRSLGGRGEFTRFRLGEHRVGVHDADRAEAVQFRAQREHQVASQPGEGGIGPARCEGKNRDE